VYKKFVEFCYLREIKKDETFRPDEIVELLELSCEYCMLDLRQLIERHLIQDISLPNIVDLLNLSISFGLQ
jgi:hypothetical protein